MNAHALFLALQGALLPLLVWAAHLTPVAAGGVVTNCSDDAQFSSLLEGNQALEGGAVYPRFANAHRRSDRALRWA